MGLVFSNFALRNPRKREVASVVGGAFVLGDEVLVGAIALQDMDLVIAPALATVTVNPASPRIARGFAYGYTERT